MNGSRGPWCASLASMFFSAAICVASGGDAFDWKTMLELPPERRTEGNALHRWSRDFAAMPLLTADEWALAASRPDDSTDRDTRARLSEWCARWSRELDRFVLEADEFAEFPRPLGPEGAVPEASALRTLAHLKSVRVRLNWLDGRHSEAASDAADVIRIGGAACGGATSMAALLASLAVHTAGLDGALWIARQPGTTSAEIRQLELAIAATRENLVTGLANTARGEYQLVFRVVVDRLPKTGDLATMLEAVSSLGNPSRTFSEEMGRLGIVENVLLDKPATLEARGRPLAAFLRALEEKGLWPGESFDVEERARGARSKSELGAFGSFAFTSDFDTATHDDMGPVLEVLERVPNPVGKLLLVILPSGAGTLTDLVFRHEARRRGVLALVALRSRLLRAERPPDSIDDLCDATTTRDDLIDPFSGMPLRFDPRRLFVWSVGPGRSNARRGSLETTGSNSDEMALSWSLPSELAGAVQTDASTNG